MVATYTLGPRTRFEWHEHAVHQLSVAADGVLSLGVDDQGWVLPQSRGLWIPAHTRHTVESIGGARMTTLWFDPACCPIQWSEPTVVDVDDLLIALVRRLDDDTLAALERTRLEAVAFDSLRPLPVNVVDLPDPRDDRLRRITDALRDDPADGRTLVEWGKVVGASDRTLIRAFVADTGIGFHEWRTRARVAAAVPQLASGRPVAVVAGAVGYSTASAFGAAFRRTTGVTPTAYLGARRH